MTTKELFLDQFNACYDEENWFVPLIRAIEGLTMEQAKWNDGSTNHSILQLVHHLIFWNGRYLLRFKEFPLPELEKSTEDLTFEIDIANWDSTLRKLNEVFTDLRDAFQNASEEKLQSSPFKDSADPWYSLIANINIHNAYHIGQIVYIRKLQGSWEKG
ncbi:MAG: DinB family protein [Ignavibacteria bacterium]|nr:DinB family protein [Ignavibacteria bacterium]